MGDAPQTSKHKARLFVIDKNPLELIGLKTILSDCVIKVHSEDEIITRVMLAELDEWQPEAILADVTSYDREIDAYTRTVRRRLGIPLLWLAATTDRELTIDAVTAGAAGCVPKDDFRMIAAAVESILAGEVYFPTKVLAEFAFELGLFFPPSGRHLKDLTKRERLIFMMMREGATNYQIAGELAISVETVKAHIRNIRQAYGALSKRQLVPQFPTESMKAPEEPDEKVSAEELIG